jgi:uncharacterized protein YcbK (DUF882 family)
MDTQHFHASEMTCHDGTPYPEEWVTTRLPALFRTLEAIRRKVGDLPIKILCGYRTERYNAGLRARGLEGESGATGVAQHSQHCEGRAADIACFGMDTEVLLGHIVEAWEQGLLPELGGVGFYKRHGFCHVDIYRLADGHLRRWLG